MPEGSMGHDAYMDALCESAGLDDLVQQKIWLTIDKKPIHVTNMTENHIRNCIAMLERQEDKITLNGMGWLEIFEDELNRRKK